MKNLHVTKKSIILLLCIFFATTNLFASSISVGITGSMSVADIESSIQSSIDGTASGDIVVVTGIKSGEDGVIALNIPAGVTVMWNAFTKDMSIHVDGGGTFEVTANGKLEVIDKDDNTIEAIKVENGNVIVSGGIVSATGSGRIYSVARSILVENGNVTVTGGEVSTAGSTWTVLDSVQIFGAAIEVKNGDVTVSGGKVSALRRDVNDMAYAMTIHVIRNYANVTVSGGEVSSVGNSAAIYAEGRVSNVRVSSGKVSATAGAGWTSSCYGIRLYADGAIAVTGGLVSAAGAANNYAININYGLVAYYKGTISEGDAIVYYEDYSIIVEVDTLEVPPTYHGTYNGMTRIEGGALSGIQWDLSGTIPYIKCSYMDSFNYSTPWIKPSPYGVTEMFVVRHRETGNLYKMISEAIDAVKVGYNTFTLEVIGDVIDTSDIIIDSENVTIVGAEGSHTVTMLSPSRPSLSFSLTGGGSLTLGEGIPKDVLSISHPVNVTNGTIHVNDGIKIESNNIALTLNGSNVNGTISGGRLEGINTSLNMINGAKLSNISGGIFTSKDRTVDISGVGTRIDFISGGIFYQTDTNRVYTISGSNTVTVQNAATIGEFSGGYFDAVRNCALFITYGGWVDKISGGEFVATRPGSTRALTSANDQWNSVIYVLTTSSGGYLLAGIDTISGGHFHGGAHFGMLLLTDGAGIISRTNAITGGLFEGIVAVQNDVGGRIGTISGGKLYGSQGMLNIGIIDKISGNVDIRGSSTYGIFNYYTNSSLYGRIGEISGGSITGIRNHGLQNSGVVDSITGGTITSLASTGHGITNSSSSNPSPRIGKITGGTIKSMELGNGIYNAGSIGEISGGEISGGWGHAGWYTGPGYGNGIYNYGGTIPKISNATVIGYRHAINCVSRGGFIGSVDTIFNGVFWGKTEQAINLVKPMVLEPGLDAVIGFGRYWGNNGEIFNDDDLVDFPINELINVKYQMSIETKVVEDIQEVEFKYLRLPKPVVDSINTPTLCSGESFDLTIPAINDNGNAVTAQGWELETNVGSGDYTIVTLPHQVFYSDNGKKIRYYATNSGGTSYSNEVTITIIVPQKPKVNVRATQR